MNTVLFGTALMGHMVGLELVLAVLLGIFGGMILGVLLVGVLFAYLDNVKMVKAIAEIEKNEEKEVIKRRLPKIQAHKHPIRRHGRIQRKPVPAKKTTQLQRVAMLT